MKLVKHEIDNTESNLSLKGAEVILIDQNEISDNEIEESIKTDIRAYLSFHKKLKFYRELLPIFIADLRAGRKITLNGFVYTLHVTQP